MNDSQPNPFSSPSNRFMRFEDRVAEGCLLKHTPVDFVQEPYFPGLCPLTDAVRTLSNAGIEARGAVFTRREVVNFILDLSGYTVDRPLHELRLLEPSFGDGDFLVPAVQRLLTAWHEAGKPDAVSSLANSIRAVELHESTFAATRQQILALLMEYRIPAQHAEQIAHQWLIHGDFLLVDLAGVFDVVVGNPPYVRQELIPDVLIREYRARYKTVYDRADIYIPFIERSLSCLAQDGVLGFICADRWMKNRYGGPLRQMVSDNFHLKVYIDMVDTQAFHADVIAYPAITVIGRGKAGPTRIAHRPRIDSNSLGILSRDLVARKLNPVNELIREMPNITSGAEPWILDCSDQLALVRRLEAAFPTLEEAQCKVGIGVATGADKEFIGLFDELDVEPNRKLPLVMTRDIDRGTVKWRGYGVVNPFSDNGGLVDLQKYPRLRKYLEDRKSRIAKRHIARKVPANWYRTIDRIYPSIAAKPKLLIPDIKGAAHIVFEDEGLYPHHNLYFIVSDAWDLRALQAVLMSGIARLFISAYSTKMRGGYLRFQAQYLRRIRVPRWSDVPVKTRNELIRAATRADIASCRRAVFSLYRLTEQELDILKGVDIGAA